MSELTGYERETIISYNEAEKTANVHTHNKTLRRKLEQLAAERPEECRLEKVSRFYEAVDYTVPKAWVKIRPTRILSEEQRTAMSERGKSNVLFRNTRTTDREQDGQAAETGKDTSEGSAAVDGP
ncbi:MAG: molecular chaperone [Oscillospiraceae bacterium]|nr:molecular chaperone [Oscillospiraceae bacterium]